MGCVCRRKKIRKNRSVDEVYPSINPRYHSPTNASGDSSIADSPIGSVVETTVITPTSFLDGQTTVHDEAEKLESVTPRRHRMITPIQSVLVPTAETSQRFSSPQIESAVREFDEALRRFGTSNSCPNNISLSEHLASDLRDVPTTVLRPQRHEEIALPQFEQNLTWTDQTDFNLSRISRLIPQLYDDKRIPIFDESNLNESESFNDKKRTSQEATETSGTPFGNVEIEKVKNIDMSLPKTSRWLLTNSTTSETMFSEKCDMSSTRQLSTRDSHSSTRSRNSNRDVSRTFNLSSNSSEFIKSLQSFWSSFASNITARFPIQAAVEESNVTLPLSSSVQESSQRWTALFPSLFTACGQIKNTSDPTIDIVACL